MDSGEVVSTPPLQDELRAVAKFDEFDVIERAADELDRLTAENEALRKALAEWLTLDESFTRCDFGFLRGMVDKGHRLAPVVLKTRLILEPALK